MVTAEQWATWACLMITVLGFAMMVLLAWIKNGPRRK